jgi:hypothetical protein
MNSWGKSRYLHNNMMSNPIAPEGNSPVPIQKFYMKIDWDITLYFFNLV